MVSPRAFLAVIALAPFALVVCKPKDVPPGEVTVASVPPTLVPPSPTLSADRAAASACADLDAQIARTLQERACKVEADCTTGNYPCRCSVPMAASARPRLDALTKDFDAKKCLAVLPRPCATCEAPPPVRCVDGRCDVK